MAHDLGFRVVAEGVETQDAYEELLRLGCDEGQGYLISRPVPVPVPASEIGRWHGPTPTS